MTYDHDAAMKRPNVGIAKVGPSRWFWVFWPTLRACFDGDEPHRYGFADSYESAVESCGGIQNLRVDSFRPGRIIPGAHYALRWRSIFAARRRKPNTKAVETKATEYVYHHYRCDRQHTCGHRITKKTRKKIFIIEHCSHEAHVDDTGGVFRVAQMALDRAKLEAGEDIYVNHGAFSGSMCGIYFTLSAEPPWKDCESNVPECFAALGLKSSATAAQVKRAFRRLSKKLHPDVGGDADAFRHLHEQYESALILVPR